MVDKRNALYTDLSVKKQQFASRKSLKKVVTFGIMIKESLNVKIVISSGI